MAALANIYSMMEKGALRLSTLTMNWAAALPSAPSTKTNLLAAAESAPAAQAEAEPATMTQPAAKWFSKPSTSTSTTSSTSSTTSTRAITAKPALAPLRGFANEDISFYVKQIDNSGVVRAVDPQSRGNAWKLIGTVTAASVLGVGILLPGAYGLIAGYDIQRLKAEAKTLDEQRAVLDLRAAKLMTPARMEALAAEQGLTDPAPLSVVYLDSDKPEAGKDNLASNRTPGSSRDEAGTR